MIGLALHRRQRASILAAVLILIPIALVLFVVLFTRIEVSYRETSRHQQRVQARLLAEAALVLAEDKLQHEPNAPHEFEGSIEEVGGVYRLIPGALIPGRTEDAASFIAQGETTRHQWRTISKITVRIVDEEGAPRVQPLTHSFQVISVPTIADR
jgi:hypothetical protein